MIHLLLVLAFMAPQQPATKRNPRSVHGLVKEIICAENARPRNMTAWIRFMKENGLSPLPGITGEETENGRMWSLSTPDGEVRSSAFFFKDETSYFLLFFPKGESAVPGPVTQWLLAHPAKLTDGDALEVALPTANRCGGTTNGDAALFSLSSGRIIRLSFSARYKTE